MSYKNACQKLVDAERRLAEAEPASEQWFTARAEVAQAHREVEMWERGDEYL